MTLVLSVQPYYPGVDDSLTEYPIGHTITIDVDEEHDPVIPLPLIEHYLKKCLADGLITNGMNVSACLWREKCHPDTMEDTSDVVVWFSTAVVNLHSDTSVWW